MFKRKKALKIIRAAIADNVDYSHIVGMLDMAYLLGKIKPWEYAGLYIALENKAKGKQNNE